jgi:hypothetical protein
MPNADAMDRCLQFMRLLILSYIVPVLGKQLEVFQSKPAILVPAFFSRDWTTRMVHFMIKLRVKLYARLNVQYQGGQTWLWSTK